ncbi:MAG: glycosyltransferase [Candidatus Hodarchaeota archaeon]
MERKKNLKFIWISSFGQLVEIRIREISKRLINRNITPIILTYRTKRKKILSKIDLEKDPYIFHLRNPFFINFKSKYMKFLREIILRFTFFLNGMPLLYSDVKNLLKKDTNIKFIYATGPSFFTHILAYILKRKFNLPLIVEYTDPWYRNPYKEGRIRWLEKKIDYIIEKQILNSADIIVSLSEFLNSIMKRNFPFIRNKSIYSIEDGLNLQEITQVKEIEEKRIIITYTGTIYGRRNIIPLFKVISQLKKENFFENVAILIKIYGKYPKSTFEKLIKKLNIEELFYLGDFLPRSEIIEEIKKCDLALHIGENLDYPTIAFKVWEYFSCRKKILFFNLEHSYRSSFIRENNLGVVIPINNLKKGKKILEELLLDIKNNRFNTLIDDSLLQKFTWENRVESFINNVINNVKL